MQHKIFNNFIYYNLKNIKMKKKILFFFSILLFSCELLAEDYMVTGAGVEAVNGTYTSTGSTNIYGDPVWTNGSYYLSPISMMSSWYISSDSDFPDMSPYYRNNSQSPFDANTPPKDGWERDMMGTDPAPTIGSAGKSISISENIFYESQNDDGSLPGNITIEINKFENETFTGNTGDNLIENEKLTINYLPNGIIANAYLLSDSTINFYLSGNAVNNDNENSYDTLQLVFSNGAFSGNKADSVINSILYLSIDFMQKITVGSSGEDYATITEAVNASTKYDQIIISEGIYTESGITIPHRLKIFGAGPDKTIVQAAATAAEATDRVFDVTYYQDTVYFSGITVQNGNYTRKEYSFSGGGINSLAFLIIKDCVITGNIFKETSGSYLAYGGGVKSYGLYMENCLVSNNRVFHTANTALGAGIASYYSTTIINSTITNNISESTVSSVHGGGIFCNQGPLNIINSTVSNNDASNNIYTVNYTNSSIYNSIIWGGIGCIDFYQVNGGTCNVYNSIVRDTSLVQINGDSSNVYSSDPLLLDLADYGGASMTRALSPGSPAINTADETYAPSKDQRGYCRQGIADIGAYEYNGPAPTYNLLDVNECNSYNSPSGKTWTESGTYVDTIPNIAGCDSIITINLVLGESNTGTDVQSACDSYTWIDGNTYTESNNTATYTLTNLAGCDSVVTLNLTILESTSGTDVQTACDSYTWIDENTYTESNNTATYTFTNQAGCDSVVTLNLTIVESSSSTDVQTACDSYTWIDGNTYTESNNTATYTLSNAAGCDSVVTLNLTLNEITFSSITETSTGSYTSPSGQIWNESNIYIDTISNVAGCDSIITINLTINTTSVSQPINLNGINYYPNPTSGLVTFDFAKNNVQELKIIDITGRIIYIETKNIKRITSIDLSNFNNGIYVVSLKTNNKIYNLSIIKE